MIDLATETLLTLEEAGRRLLVTTSTIHRWITHGSKGIRLEAGKVGSRWRTSEEALQRFSDRLTATTEAAPLPESTPPPRTSVYTPKQRQRHLEQVERELDAWFGVRRCESCGTRIEPKNVVIPKHERIWCPKCLVKRKSATLGRRIRTFRWVASMPQHELSARTGIRIDDIRDYEFDRKVPPEAHLAKLIEALGEDLVSGYAVRSGAGPKPTETEG
jgi:hypothetical protein